LGAVEQAEQPARRRPRLSRRHARRVLLRQPRRAALDQAEPRDRGDVAHPQHVADAVAAAPVDHPLDHAIAAVVAAIAVVAALGLRGARLAAIAPVVVAGPAGTLVALAGIAAVRLRAVRVAAIRIAAIGRAIPA